MKCLELIQKLETLAPADCACEWDNVGLLVGWREREIHRILIALDATDEVVEEAVRMRRIFYSHTIRLFLNRLGRSMTMTS